MILLMIGRQNYFEITFLHEFEDFAWNVFMDVIT